MILDKNLFSEFIADHLFYFTKETLISTLERNGFEIIDCKGIWHDYIISATIRKRKKVNVSQFYDHQMKIKREINDYICSFGQAPVAVWGAGHQSLSVLSLSLSNKILFSTLITLFFSYFSSSATLSAFVVSEPIPLVSEVILKEFLLF